MILLSIPDGKKASWGVAREVGGLLNYGHVQHMRRRLSDYSSMTLTHHR